MTDSDTTIRSVYIWIGEGTWRATVDAALSLAPARARFTLLHVTSPAAADAAHGAYRGMLGRAGHDPGERLEALASASAADLIEAAARRLGRPCERREIHDQTERAVVAASATADLLIVARDGDRSGSARRAWAGPPGLSWITSPARSCSSGRRRRRTSAPFPRRHITLTPAALRIGRQPMVDDCPCVNL